LRDFWWRFGRPRVEMRVALAPLERFIATPHVSKHRVFAYVDRAVLPDQMLIVIARDDDTTFGILSSRFHELWSLRLGTSLEDRPRYTPTTCFETFPFPNGLTPLDSRRRGNDDEHGIAEAARKLNELRENWLNPKEWVEWVITPEEEKAGFPKRPVAKAVFDAQVKKRTLTNLYNERPAWLDTAHKNLDMAVARAYGWEDYKAEIEDEEILRSLLGLNQSFLNKTDHHSNKTVPNLL